MQQVLEVEEEEETTAEPPTRMDETGRQADVHPHSGFGNIDSIMGPVMSATDHRKMGSFKILNRNSNPL